MSRSTVDLDNSAIGVLDGRDGHHEDSYFDDDAWDIRHLVVDTRSRLWSGRS